jgi:hypothetical protein
MTPDATLMPTICDIMEQVQLELAAAKAQVQQEIAAAKAQQEQPGLDFWAVVERESAFYVWLHLHSHGQPIVPAKAVQHAIECAQQVQAAGGGTALMTRFHILLTAVNDQIISIMEKEAAQPATVPRLTTAQLVAAARAQVAKKYPFAPLNWFDTSPQVN